MSTFFQIMPSWCKMSEPTLEELEASGGLKPRTMAARQRELQYFLAYWEVEGTEGLEELFKTPEGCAKFSKQLGRCMYDFLFILAFFNLFCFRYFFQYRVKDKDGKMVVPKRQTAESARSRLKAELMTKFKVDISDPIMFPDMEKKWKAMVTTIVAAGRNETEHHEEVNPETMLAIYMLLGTVVAVLKVRGRPDYQKLLATVPVDLQGKLHLILQWGAIFVLVMFEVRRGVENLDNLESPDFVEFKDKLWKFQYIKKVVSEAEKNNQGGSNTKCHGVIPDLLVTDNFNLFELFQLYKSLIPVVPNKKTNKIYLFPKPRLASRKFNPHDLEAVLYKSNQKGEG